MATWPEWIQEHHEVYYYFKWHIGKIGIILIDTQHKKVRHVSLHVQSVVTSLSSSGTAGAVHITAAFPPKMLQHTLRSSCVKIFLHGANQRVHKVFLYSCATQSSPDMPYVLPNFFGRLAAHLHHIRNLPQSTIATQYIPAYLACCFTSDDQREV